MTSMRWFPFTTNSRLSVSDCQVIKWIQCQWLIQFTALFCWQAVSHFQSRTKLPTAIFQLDPFQFLEWLSHLNTFNLFVIIVVFLVFHLLVFFFVLFFFFFSEVSGSVSFRALPYMVFGPKARICGRNDSTTEPGRTPGAGIWSSGTLYPELG